MRYKFNTRWKEKELQCACLFGNPGCDRFKVCEVLEFSLKPYEGINECMDHDSFERRHGVIIDKGRNHK